MEKNLPEEPLTLKELNEQIKNRVDHIKDEFTQGFDFLKTCEKSVTFFGSARIKEGDKDYEQARKLAGRIASELDYAIVTGGGPGIMEAANRGAYEADRKSIGLTIYLPMEQKTNPYLSAHLGFHYFFVRKVCLTYAAEAYIYFPGGFGTMDEFFEILTLVQTNKIEEVPIILFGSEYWKPLEEYIKEKLLKHKKVDAKDLELYTITDDEEEVLEIIKNSPIRKAS
jgi:uncharacterized protein (TIGR00730 family)